MRTTTNKTKERITKQSKGKHMSIVNKDTKNELRRYCQKIFLMALIMFWGYFGFAQNEIVTSSFSACQSQQTVVVIDNYCGTCVYKFGKQGGTFTTVTPVSGPTIPGGPPPPPPVEGGTANFSYYLEPGTYQLKKDNNVVGTLTFSIESEPVMSISTGGVFTIGCDGDQITLTATTGGSNYTWTKNGASFSSGQSITVPFDAGSIDTYAVSANFSYCGSSVAKSANVEIQGRYEMSGVSISGAGSRCAGAGSTTFTFNGSNYTSLSAWSIDQGGTINGSGKVTWDPAFDETATITRTAYDDCGNSMTASKSITMIKLPVKYDLNVSKSELCTGETASFSLPSAIPGVTYALYRVGENDPLTEIVATTSDLLFLGNHGTSGEYYATATNSCLQLEMNNRITLSSLPDRTPSVEITLSELLLADADGDFYLCDGTDVTLGFSETGVALTTWRWKRNGSPVGSQNQNTLTITQPGTYTLDIIDYDLDTEQCYTGAVNDQNISFSLHGTLTANISGDGTRCVGPGSTTFNFSASNHTSLSSWSIDQGGTINNSGKVTWDPAFDGTATISRTASGHCGPDITATKTITMIDVPDKHDLEASKEELCTNESATIYMPGSTSGITYSLYRVGQADAVKEITAVSNGLLSFGSYSSLGEYYVMGENECGSEEMNNRVTLSRASSNTASASIIYSGDYGFDINNNKLHVCGDASLTLTMSTVGLNVTSWHWRKDGVKISGTDNDNSYTPTTDGIYELRLQSWSFDTENCYTGSITDPTVNVNVINASNLQNVSTSFHECQSSRSISFTLANGNELPASYDVDWYDTDENLLGAEPNFDALAVGQHQFKVKGKRVNAHEICHSPAFATVTININALDVEITDPAANSLVATGSMMDITSSVTNSYGDISYALEGAGTSTSIPNIASFTVPADATWGDDYRIKATTCAGNFYSETFYVGDYNRSTLIQPEAGTIAFTGEPVIVEWIRRPGDQYKFIYESLETGEIVEEVLNNSELTVGTVSYSFLWEVPETLLGAYALKIEEVAGNYQYTGDITFRPELDLIVPLVGNSYEIGYQLTVAWRGGEVSEVAPVTMELLKGGAFLLEIGAHTGSVRYNWPIPNTLEEGNDYRVRISQTLNGVTKSGTMDGDFSLIHCTLPLDPTASEDQNYVKEYTAREPYGACLSGLNQRDKVQESINYIDGLGRPLQTVIRNSTPLANGNTFDLLSIYEYDELGRQPKQHLPFASDFNDGRYVDMNTPEGLAMKEGFHASLYPGQESYAFAETMYEPSPLSRVVAQGAPGEHWQLGSGHELETAYQTNGIEEVMYLSVSDGWIEFSYYTENELAKTVSRDENTDQVTDGEEGISITFTDKLGQTVLKATRLTGDDYAETYYIYDDLGNLSFVVQPEGIRLIQDPDETAYDWSSLNDEAFRKNWMFSYEYDHRQRLIRKRVPGADWVEMVYDDRDRLVLTRDGNQNAENLNNEEVLYNSDLSGNSLMTTVFDPGKITLDVNFKFEAGNGVSFVAEAKPIPDDDGWEFTKYDQLNRPVMTGLVANHGTREEMQAALDNFYNAGGEYTEQIDPTSTTGYTNRSFPMIDGEGQQLDLSDLYTITYYDDYSFSEEVIPSDAMGVVSGQITGSKTRVLGKDTWLTTSSFYDDRYRVIKSVTDNFIGGEDVISNTFRNEISPIVANAEVVHTGGESVSVSEGFEYDHMDRMMSSSHSINGSAPVDLVKIRYNKIGELIEKNLGNAINPVQSVDYRYNIRGWMTHINEGASLDNGLENDLFGLQLLYADAPEGHQQYNGNIGQMIWRSKGGDQQTTDQNYRYDYDASGRIKSADYTGVGDFDVSNIQYNFNGNISTLNRMQRVKFFDADGQNSFSNKIIDQLEYAYGSGNQLSSVVDHSPAEELFDLRPDSDGRRVKDLGFQDGATDVEEYIYDPNGNMIRDRNKGIASISYNYLNLPLEVMLENGTTIIYTYDASGVKLRKTVSSGTTNTTDYNGVFHFTNDALTFMQHSEGRAIKNGSDFDYEYNLTDHLGNVRVTVNENGGVIQRDDYYPFGLTFNHYNQSIAGGGENLYKYNDFEQQKETGWYDYLARYYDPELGRFNSVDPLSDLMRRYSPYTYAFDNPIRFIDPDGMMPSDTVKRDCIGCDGPADQNALINPTALPSNIKPGPFKPKPTPSILGAGSALLRILTSPLWLLAVLVSGDSDGQFTMYAGGEDEEAEEFERLARKPPQSLTPEEEKRLNYLKYWYYFDKGKVAIYPPVSLPDKDVKSGEGIQIKHNYGNTGTGDGSLREHGPIHFHVKYKGIEYELFPSGKPLKHSKTPPKKVIEFMKKHRKLLHKVERQIGKWYGQLPPELKRK